MKGRRPLAFTLVELLVVIGIISVLIGILLPVLRKARSAAEQQVCGSNLRQIAMGAFFYSVDNKGECIPGAAISVQSLTVNGFTGPGYLSWDYGAVSGHFDYSQGLLGRYLGKAKILQCPVNEALNMPITDVQNTYGQCLINVTQISQIQRASETPIFADALSLQHVNGQLAPFRPTQIYRPSLCGETIIQGQSPTQGPLDAFSGCHGHGYGEVGFYDGHVEAIKAQVRPAATYLSPPSQMSVVQAMNIAPLYGGKINFADDPDPASYEANCTSTYDYYFWTNKDTKVNSSSLH